MQMPDHAILIEPLSEGDGAGSCRRFPIFLAACGTARCGVAAASGQRRGSGATGCRRGDSLYDKS